MPYNTPAPTDYLGLLRGANHLHQAIAALDTLLVQQPALRNSLLDALDLTLEAWTAAVGVPEPDRSAAVEQIQASLALGRTVTGALSLFIADNIPTIPADGPEPVAEATAAEQFATLTTERI